MKNELSMVSKGSEVEQPRKLNLKKQQALFLASQASIERFMGALVVKSDNGYSYLSSDEFASLCYAYLGVGTTRSQIQDLEHLYSTSAPEAKHLSYLIGFPDGTAWDMRKLAISDEYKASDCMYQCKVSPTHGSVHKGWLRDITLNKKDLERDVMWALAPVFMHHKPFGVFWFLGRGANGKSTLVKTVYELFGGLDEAPFTSFSLTQIEDGRDLPKMNGKLANLCIESHDGHIADAGNYKHLADHDNLEIHAMRRNNTITVNGNIHSIFNSNNVPTFADKTKSIRDRTFTIPFEAEFPRDPSFDEKLWATPNFLSDFLGELLDTTRIIRDNGYQYRLSNDTIDAKRSYDEEANTAEAYFTELIANRILGFDNHNVLYWDYETWCKNRGSVPLGRRNVSAAARSSSFYRHIVKTDDGDKYVYLFADTSIEQVEPMKKRYGLYQERGADADHNIKADHSTALLEQLMEAL